jgi:predicted transcriptional regulator
MPPDTDIGQAIVFLDEARANSWPVGAGRRVAGIVNLQQIKEADHVLTVGDLISGHDGYPHAHSDHQVTWVLDRMRKEGLDTLAVVSRADIHELLGVVTLARILASYGIEGKRSPGFTDRKDLE